MEFKRKWKDHVLKSLVNISAAFTVTILVVIIGFIFIKGLPGINVDFLIKDYEDKTTYVTAVMVADQKENAASGEDGKWEIKSLGLTLEWDEKEGIKISAVESDSSVKEAVDGNQNVYAVKKGDYITKIDSLDLAQELKKLPEGDSGETILQKAAEQLQNSDKDTVRLKIVRPGGGIFPMVVTTLYMIILSLAVAAPIGILSAVYLNEYAKPGKLVSMIHFAIENLAGIPSIIYGLFGSLFFVQICKMQYSLLAGALTVSIILLPIIISTTEETLKSIPRSYRESSLGLGATKLQTVMKVVLPNALSGILTAVLLSIGRIVGESAALLLTLGTVAQIPSALAGNSASGATLTLKAYTLMKEENDLTTACAIGIVLLVLIITLNLLSRFITGKLEAKRGQV